MFEFFLLHQGQPTLNVRSELAEPARETLSSRQDVGNNYETSEAGPSEGNKVHIIIHVICCFVEIVCWACISISPYKSHELETKYKCSLTWKNIANVASVYCVNTYNLLQ